MSVTEPTKVER